MNVHIMKSVLPILTFVILLAPLSANAEWYWLTIPEDPTIGEFTELSAVEYAVTSIPKDQLQSVDESFFKTLDSAEKSESCSSQYSLASVIDELRKFDEDHDFYEVVETIEESEFKGHTYTVISTTTSQNTIDSRSKLLVSIETKANDCLEREKQDIEKNIRAEEIQTALNECDSDFFENEMTNDERMDTWNERQECKVEIDAKKPEVTTVIPEVVKAPIIEPEVTYVPTQSITPTPVPVVPKPELKETSNEVEEVAPTTSEPKIDHIQEIEEIETDIKLDVPEVTEEKTSFFKRVTNFFSRLFSW